MNAVHEPGIPASAIPPAGAPGQGTPQPATPQPGTPQPGTPQPGTPQPGTPQPGTPQPGTPQPGTREPGQLDPDIAQLLKRDAAGLVAAVIQQFDTGEVLMVGWMNDAALHATLTTGRTTFWSRSRQEFWVKGETSGHRQWVREVRLDCDGDTLLVQVDQEGPACHTGDRTCFDGRVLWSRETARA